jgi:rubrerythrin
MSIMDDMMAKMTESIKDGSKSEKNFRWTTDAQSRLERVPEGFMRSMTKNRIEEYAEKLRVDEITLAVAENGISGAKDMMTSMMGSGTTGKDIAVKQEETFKIDEDVDYYHCDVCGYTIKGYAPDECPICRANSEKFSLVENKEELVTPSSGKVLDWTTTAIERLSKTPEGFMRDMTKWRIESFVRRSGSPKVTEELIEKKYEYWGEGSKKIIIKMEWEQEAQEKISRIPSFVRGMVIKEVERQAQENGETTVTLETLSSVSNKWNSSMEFHTDLQED